MLRYIQMKQCTVYTIFLHLFVLIYYNYLFICGRERRERSHIYVCIVYNIYIHYVIHRNQPTESKYNIHQLMCTAEKHCSVLQYLGQTIYVRMEKSCGKKEKIAKCLVLRTPRQTKCGMPLRSTSEKRNTVLSTSDKHS